MSAITLTERGHSEIDALLRGACERRDVPGVVAALANGGRVLYLGAAGTLDEAGATPMSTDAVFRILSMTKPVTSVGIMLLCEQVLLGLDDPLGQYLPEFAGRAVIAEFDAAGGTLTTRPAGGEVSIRQLLAHTAGFGYGFCNHTLNVLEKTGAARTLPLLHDPGSRWTYGMSTRLLGEVIEQVAGRPLDAFLAEHIFEPLGMTETAFGIKPDALGRLAALWHREDGALRPDLRPAPYTPFVAGDAGLLSTAGDYIRFLQMLLQGGAIPGGPVGRTRMTAASSRSDLRAGTGSAPRAGGRLLQESSVAEMLRNQIGSLTVEQQPGAIPSLSEPFPLGAGVDKFGLGFQLKARADQGMRAPGSGSWAGLYNTHFWIDPHTGIAAVLLMQLLPFYDAQCIALLTEFERRIYANLTASAQDAERGQPLAR